MPGAELKQLLSLLKSLGTLLATSIDYQTSEGDSVDTTMLQSLEKACGSNQQAVETE